MARGWWVGLCLALAAPAVFADIHKCVDERSGRVAYSDMPCRDREAPAATLAAPRAGTRPAPVAVVVETAGRPVQPLQLQGSPQSIMAMATAAVKQMADSGEGCQLTLQHRRATGEAPSGCRDFLAQLNVWRGPIVLELARLSVDKDFITPAQTTRLTSVVEMLGRIRGYEEFALRRLGPDAGIEQARR